MLVHRLPALVVSDEKFMIIFNSVLLYLLCLFSVAAFKIFSVSLFVVVVSSLIVICLGMIFLMFVLLGVHGASWICKL